jgi:hypothetical protein
VLRLVLLPLSQPAAGANYHERCARGSARPLQALLVCAMGTSANRRFFRCLKGDGWRQSYYANYPSLEQLQETSYLGLTS